MKNDSPLILFSGMGADERVFAEQKKAISVLSVPPWIEPKPDESLASYAARWAPQIDPGLPCFIGGASFGGFIALEMIPHLDVIACFLIGSVRSPAQFPKPLKVLRKVPPLAGAVPFEAIALLSKVAILSGGVFAGAQARELLRQMTEADASFLRWACRAALAWEPSPIPAGVPVFQIHGARDPVLPVDETTPDVVVAGAGHALSMSHPEEVTSFLREKMQQSAPVRVAEAIFPVLKR